jgi:acyl-CoA dehydrogenase
VSQEQSTAEQADDARMIIDLVAKFVDQELMPLEAAVLAREIKGEQLKLLPEEEAPLKNVKS